ncbi:MAG: histidine--tRNA ligase [Lachnospiraceae bacterium]|nr:histidine--tRNA ligase [Lachnospiraceae bacterium]
MALTKKPVTGMKDILPAEMEIRDYCISIIKKTYAEFGFLSIETPCVENLENLTSKSGGDNEKLIFKILKRGEKLQSALAQTARDAAGQEGAISDLPLSDGGLRYDLTVPLVRYFSAHENELPMPFKALQMGNVWRADRPQKGRYRQFMQCDIDIIGEATNLAEIELILATTTTLGRLGFKGFQIRINDRQILKAMAAACGFPAERCDEVFIILDKMDKIGRDGVLRELEEAGFAKESAQRYVALFDGLDEVCRGTEPGSEEHSAKALDYLEKELAGVIGEDVLPGLREIFQSVNAAKSADFVLVFDPTIVRGMSYYTGTIFEIAMPELGISCGGGGRYDGMVGRFTGKDVPACGFSIGFERIILILLEQNYVIPGQPAKTAYLIEKNMPSEKLSGIIRQAQQAREAGEQVLLVRMNKNKKFQKEQLSAQGYEKFEEFYAQ